MYFLHSTERAKDDNSSTNKEENCISLPPLRYSIHPQKMWIETSAALAVRENSFLPIHSCIGGERKENCGRIRGGVWIAISKLSKDTRKRPAPSSRHPSTSSTRSRHSLKKNGLYKVRYCFTVAAGDYFGWTVIDGGRRMRWMKGHLVGWAFVVSFNLPRRSRRPSLQLSFAFSTKCLDLID